jgi:hypothetical protein
MSVTKQPSKRESQMIGINNYIMLKHGVTSLNQLTFMEKAKALAHVGLNKTNM